MGKRREVDARGFTLLELIVTLFVIALAVGIVVPVVGRSTDSLRGRSDIARFSAMLRHARDQAITTRRGHAVVVDPAAHRVLIVAAPDEVRQTRLLSADLGVEATPPEALTVRFEPSGVSSGGNFRLTTGRMRYRVTIDPFTGRVRVERQE
jgi:prepilin-type N-terminal cleavage/methylation domain-containing protein